MGKDKSKSDFPEYIFGGPGKDWYRFGNVVVNDSKEGWDSMEKMWDAFILVGLILGGIVSFFCGLIFLGIILAGLGIWGFASAKAWKWITRIITWIIAIVVVICIIWFVITFL